jgi:hypothetical protein
MPGFPTASDKPLFTWFHSVQLAPFMIPLMYKRCNLYFFKLMVKVWLKYFLRNKYDSYFNHILTKSFQTLQVLPFIHRRHQTFLCIRDVLKRESRDGYEAVAVNVF